MEPRRRRDRRGTPDWIGSLPGGAPAARPANHRDERRDAALRYLGANLDHFRNHDPDRMARHMMRGIDGSAEPGAMTTELAPIYIKCYSRLEGLLSGHSPIGSVT